MKLATTYDRQKLCTVAGISLATAGLSTAAVAGSDMILGNALAVAKVLSFVVVALAAIAGFVAAVHFLSKRLPRFLIFLTVSLTGIMAIAFVVAVVLPGWTRIFGYEANGLPGFGSAPFGIGCLGFVAGCMALAWCRTPILELETGPSVINKAGMVSAVAAFLIIMPGMFAALPPHGERVVQVEAVDAAASAAVTE